MLNSRIEICTEMNIRDLKTFSILVQISIVTLLDRNLEIIFWCLLNSV